jgi:hypothetical protein
VRFSAVALGLAAAAVAQTLPDAAPWSPEGDPVPAMISGMERYLDRLRVEFARQRRPSAEKLRHALGVVDARTPGEPERRFIGDTPLYAAEAMRWPVLHRVFGEGIHFMPKRQRQGCVVAVPDAGQAPEDFAAAREIAAAGFEVISPVLVDLDSSFAGRPSVRMSKLPHREWIYRHPVGYEVQKVLAAVDWFVAQGCESLGVYGVGDGGWVAQFAAVLDERIGAVEAVNASVEPQSLRAQPVHRNIFGLLRDFGDAEFLKLLGGRLRSFSLLCRSAR